MSSITITSDTLDDVIDEHEIVLLDFWAEWCGPCRNFAPVFEKAAETHTDIAFGKVDTEVERELASGFAIRSIPTLMVFREGIIVFEQAGALGGAQLEQVIEAVRGLDMSDVREQAAQQQESGSQF